MRKDIVSILLKSYDQNNPELFLRAKFLLATTATGIFGLTITLIYTSYTFGIASTTVTIELLGFAIMVSALLLLIKGNYTLAGHTILITGFIVVWVIMFTEPLSSVLIKLDTIVFILVLLSFIPLMFFNNKKFLFIYFSVNFIVFGIFNFDLYQQGVLTQRELVDYISDNFIAMLFILIIALNLFSIYHQALNSLKNELVEKEKAEKNLKTEKQKLHLNEERLRQAMQASQQSWFDLDLKTSEVTTSSEFVNIAGTENEHSPPTYHAWVDSIHRHDRDAVLECFSDCLKTGEARQMEYRMLTRNGEWKWIHSSAKVVAFDEASLPARMTGTHMDITQRKIAEEALQKSESRLKEAQEIARLGNFEHDFQRGTTWWSDQTYRILGFEMAAIPPDYPAFGKRLSEKDRAKLNNFFGRAEKYGEDFSIAFGYQIPDGELKYIDLQAKVVFHQNGIPKGLKGTILDVTEKKKIELQLAQSQKLQAIGTLAGGVAHDFNNILSSIFGYTQLAQHSLDSKEKLEKYLRHIMIGAERASEVVQQILTFSRKTEYKKIPLDLCREVKQAVHLLRASIPPTIDFSVSYHSTTAVSADPTRIHQVIMNLCTNGYHAMKDKGGTLTLSVYDRTITESRFIMEKTLEPGRYVCFEVTDTGCGMDKDTIAKATEPYFTTKEKGQGTGLGLALVKAIVDEHDGLLEIRSEVGKGSSFLLYLPIVFQTKDSLESVSEMVENDGKGTETIMVVDDEESIRSILKDFLEHYGYRTVLFENGLEALKAFQSDPERFDLVLTDLAMPKFSGDRLAREILHIKPNLPVLLITGNSEDLPRKTADEIGIRKILKKPFENKSVLLEIRNALDPISE
jgi:PAS domain S-box-containing protein